MPVTFPSALSARVRSMAWYPVFRTVHTDEALNGAIQVVESPGGYWRCDMELSLRQGTKGGADDFWAAWRGFEAEMAGGGIVDLPRVEPMGRESGVTASLSSSAVSGAMSIAVTWTGAAPYVGLDFGIGTRVYRIKTVTAGGGSAYTLGIWPGLRSAQNSGDALKFSNAVCRMVWAQDGRPTPRRQQTPFEVINVSFREITG